MMPYTLGDIELAAVWDAPDLCQQFGCNRKAETWCPLCRSFFCAEHDELYPSRRHDCLKGKADPV